jgi:transcriptional regulator with XRE-family HTH domain
MPNVKKHTSFGELLRTLREETGQTLKTVSEKIDIDTSLLATKLIIKQVAKYFKVNEKELQSEFLSDQIAYKILDEDADLETLKVAEEKVIYLKTIQNGK